MQRGSQERGLACGVPSGLSPRKGQSWVLRTKPVRKRPSHTAQPLRTAGVDCRQRCPPSNACLHPPPENQRPPGLKPGHSAGGCHHGPHCGLGKTTRGRGGVRVRGKSRTEVLLPQPGWAEGELPETFPHPTPQAQSPGLQTAGPPPTIPRGSKYSRRAAKAGLGEGRTSQC